MFTHVYKMLTRFSFGLPHNYGANEKMIYRTIVTIKRNESEQNRKRFHKRAPTTLALSTVPIKLTIFIL